MPDVGKMVEENGKTALGVVGGAALAGVAKKKAEEKSVAVLVDYPELIDGGLGVVGGLARFSKVLPRDWNNVADGIMIASLVGLVDDGLNRFLNKDII